MKTIVRTTITDTCPTCGSNLTMEKVDWTEMQGSLFSVKCSKCKMHGDRANCKAKAFDNFDKKRKQREKELGRKPEKILTDICTYLMERQRCLAIESRMCPKIRETALVLSMIEDLKNYAEKLGVKL